MNARPPKDAQATKSLAVPRDLTALFAPRSVAILGASDDSSKWGNALSRQMLAAGSDAEIHLVNRHGTPVLGRPTLRSIAEARIANGAPLDLVAICVPAAGFLESLDEALAAGARAVVAITAGLAEVGADGARIEAEARDRVRRRGAVLVGPNCLGVVDTTTRLQLSSEFLTAGSVAILSQSGNIVIDLADLMRDSGLGISRFVSLGNQADLGVVDFMAACVEHPGTNSVAVYVEDVLDGRAFIRAARALRAVGKPVVLLAPGRSAAATRSAASHTGSLTSATQVVDAACAAAGVHRVETPQQMVDLLAAFGSGRRSGGRRVAVLTDGGGHGAVAADAAEAAGLEVPLLGADLGRQLSGLLWMNSTVNNPVDLAGAGERDASSYAGAVSALLESDEVDAVLLTGYFGGYAAGTSNLAEPEFAAAAEIARITAAQSKPVVVHTIYPRSPSCEVLAAAGIPVYRDVVRACRVLVGLATTNAHAGLDPIDLPPPAVPLTDTGYAAARVMFSRAGIEFPPAVQVTAETQLHDALEAGAVRFPIVLKAMGLLHKSDAGGVVLGIADAATAATAYRDLIRRLDPPAVWVEQMADRNNGVELIVGTVWDATFGPVLMVGLGGIFTEVMADTAFAIVPVTPATAREMLLSLRGAPLLQGARGVEPVDLDTIAAFAARISTVAAEHPELPELEINPVLCSSRGALALDARAVAHPTSAVDRADLP